jgi:hypothetical protein
MRLSIRTDWSLPAGDTPDAYSAAKDQLAIQSKTGWRVWEGEPVLFPKVNPTGWCVGVYAGNQRSNKTAVYAEVIGVDYDDMADEHTLLNHPIVQTYALAVGHSPSHGQPWRTGARLRVLFRLDTPIAQRNEPDEKPVADRYTNVVKALLSQMPPGYDEKCIDVARFYFGCKDWFIIAPDKTLPILKLREWYKALPKPEPVDLSTMPGTPINDQHMTAYIEAAVKGELAEMAAITEGWRNNQLYDSAKSIYGLVKVGVIDRAGLDHHLTALAVGAGLQEHAVKNTLNSAWNNAKPRQLPTTTPQRTGNGQQPDMSVTPVSSPEPMPPPIIITPPITPPLPVSFVFSDDAIDQAVEEINGDAIPAVAPMLNPYKFLHRYGGFAHMLMPGKVMYLASVSGGGKTIGVESGVEACMRRGIHSIVYSPEWTDGKSKAQELMARMIQRNGGPDYQAQMMHKLHLIEKANGIRDGAGRRMLGGDISKAIASALQMRRLEGKAFYLDTPGLSTEQLCSQIGQLVEVSIEKGYPAKTAWLDFAQLLWLEDDKRAGRIWIETAINLFKDVCRQYNLVGFVTSQVKKTDAEGVKDGKALEADMMQWLSDQQANLVLLFVPELDNNEKPILGLDGNPRMRARIVKDSMKGPSIEFPISWNPQKLAWLNVDDPEPAKGKMINL